MNTSIKTGLAPNAPWPKWENQEKKPYRQREVGLKTVKIAREYVGVDYFKETREEINRCKIAAKSRTRDKLSGRFKSS